MVTDTGSSNIESDVYQRRWAILAVLCLALLVVSLDNTILNVALPTLVTSIHATATQLQWTLDAYTLVFASVLLTAGSLGDKYGRKGALMGGLALFGAVSAVCAFTATPAQLISARAAMGLGGAFIMPTTLSILTNVFPPDERGQAIGIWAGVSGIGVAVGPVTGGFLLQHFWWGSVFLVNVPIVIVALIASSAIVPSSKNPDAPPLDLVGTVLSIVGLVALLYAIIEAPSYGWGSLRILGTLALGVVVLVGFGAWELHTDHPMLNVRFFRNPRFSAASGAVALVFFALFGTLFFLTQYLQDVLGYSALQAGLRVAPVAVALMIAAPSSPALVARIGTKLVVAGGLVVVAFALWLLSLAHVGTGFSAGYPLVFTTIVLLGIGMGFAMAPATDSIMGSLPVEEAGVGSAVNDTTRQIGGALGVAVLGSLINSSYRAAIASSPVMRQLPADAHAAAANSVGAAKIVATSVGRVSGSAAAAAVARAADVAFVNAMTDAVVVGAVVALAGAIVAFVFLPSFPPAPTEELSGLAVAATRTLLPSPPAGRPSLADATMGVLSEAGHASLNFSAISAQSGVGTAAMRRGWTDRHHAVIQGIERLIGDPPGLAGGSVLEDVSALLRHLVNVVEVRMQPHVLAALVGAAGQNPELADALRTCVVRPRQHILRQRLDRAAADGELAPDADRDVLVNLLLGPIYHRALITGERMGDGFPERVAALALGPQLLGSPRAGGA